MITMQEPKTSFGKTRAEDKIQIFKTLVGERANWDTNWQTLHDYFYIESPNLNRSYAPGAELDVTYLWDSTTLDAADVFASGFMNYLTPASSKWSRLRSKSPNLTENKDVADYFEDVNDELHYALNRSNYYDQCFPSYKSSGVYGTSVIMEEEDIDDDIRFYSLPLTQVCIVEDGRGRVAEYYIEFEYTATQANDKWGDAISDEMKEELKAFKEKKHKFLLFIGKRGYRDVNKQDRKNMPFEALWIDVDKKTIVDEGGYNEWPAFCHRFDKRPFIPWGFSPAMKALPFARMLNAAAKTTMRSMMKHTDPPLALPENAFIMPFNANPRAINYYKKTAMDSGKDIFPFANTGDPQVGMSSVEYYANAVKRLMFNDVFLAFNGIDKQMNNPEIMERINEKMTLLGPAVGRWIVEVINPIVVRTIGILDRRGRLPEMPEELMENPNYEIECVGQLAQAQRRSSLNNLVTGLTMIGQMATFSPEALDKISPDKTVDEIWEITGSPVTVLRSDDEVARIRENRAKQQAAINNMQMVGAGTEVVKSASEVDKNIAQAKEIPKE